MLIVCKGEFARRRIQVVSKILRNHSCTDDTARSGFLPYQLDLAWVYIKFLHVIGGVTSYNDGKKDFYKRYYLPYHMNNETVPSEKVNQTID